VNVALLVPLVCLVVELTVGAILLVPAVSLGTGRPRWFALLAFCAAAYTATDLFPPWPHVSDAAVTLATRFSPPLAAAFAAAWVGYTRTRRGLTPLAGADGWAALACVSLGVIVSVPAMGTYGSVFEIAAPALGVTYRLPSTTPIVSVAFGLDLVLIVSAVRHVLAVAPGRRIHVAATVVVVAAGAHDVLLASNTMQSIFLADSSFVVLVVALVVDATTLVLERGRALEQRRDDLQREVDQRARALLDAQRTLDESERLVALGRMAASVGHEINNPLAYVVSNLDVIAESLPPEAKAARTALADARSGTSKIASIVRDLRVIARKDASEPEDGSLAEAVQEAVKMASPELRRGVDVQLELDPELRVGVGSGRLVQLVAGLVTNALEALATVPAPRRMRVVAASVGGRARLEVADTGSGIPPHVRARLFEPFFTTKGTGTGLGLALCDAIARHAGGTLGLGETTGRGATFFVELPIVASRTAVARPPTPAVGVARPRRVVLVDDDAAVARGFARVLSSHIVERFTDPGEALARLRDRTRPVDAVVCDVTMSPMTGPELQTALAETDPERADRFVFVTGGAVSPEAREYLAKPSVVWLEKPVSATTLRQAVEDAASRPRAVAPPSVVRTPGDGSDRPAG
jgi:signal transduction histidine kinase/ActR/RegA family two-component response regulator